MSDNANIKVFRRKIRDRSVALLVVGIVLLTPPFVQLSLIDIEIFGLPFIAVYFLFVWAALILGAFLLAPALRDRNTPSDRNRDAGGRGDGGA